MRLSAVKLSKKLMILSGIAKLVSTVKLASLANIVTLEQQSITLKPKLIVCFLGLSLITVAAQSAVTSSTDRTSKVSPTADLQLINLQNNQVAFDDVPFDNGIDDLSDVDDMLDAADQTDDWDWIDSGGDETSGVNPLVDSSDYADTTDIADNTMNTDIPAEVAQVSLNAIAPETLKTFVAVVDLVRREYVDAVNDEELFNNAMSGMLTKLDSHAEFLDVEAYENLRAFTQGDVGDVGIKAAYQANAGHWVVTAVTANSSADKKDIEVGDYLHQIDEYKLDENKQTNDVNQLLTGIAGTQVDVVVSKAGRRKLAITLQRNNNHPQTIETRLVDGMAIIKLPAFQDNSREKILTSITSLNAPVSGILLDLRDNPGGVLISAVQIASLFMTDSAVVQVESRQSALRTLSTRGAAVLEPLPVVILQNRYSASAAEVLSSSLQTQKRATIVGEVSYGKGSVQSVIPLNDEQAVKMTVAHYLTATGKKIDEIGVQPDVTLSGEEHTWEQQALDILRQQVSSSGIRFVQENSSKQKPKVVPEPSAAKEE